MGKAWITDPQEMGSFINLSEAERDYFSRQPGEGLPFQVPHYWAQRCLGPEGHIFRRQAIPTSQELEVKDYETNDPLGDLSHSPGPRMVHRYPDRLLLLVTQRCALYCRHCFRRHFTGKDQDEIDLQEITHCFQYIQKHKEIHELLLSGGDSLLLSPSKMDSIIHHAKELGRPLILRFGTRLPISHPQGVTDPLLDRIASYPYSWVLLQVNHPSELSPPVLEKIQGFKERGIPMLNQSVLLKGINDKLETLKELSYRLLDAGIKPYYIFQGDLASGTSHFRVPIEKTLALQEALRKEVSGLAMPIFAVDLPGGGKIPLTEERLLERQDQAFYFKSLEGNAIAYPRED